MRKDIFLKAIELVEKGMIKKVEENQKSAYFIVGVNGKEGINAKNEVRISYYQGILHYNCTCKFGSLKTPKYNVPCSHIIAAFILLGNEKRILGNKRRGEKRIERGRRDNTYMPIHRRRNIS